MIPSSSARKRRRNPIVATLVTIAIIAAVAFAAVAAIKFIPGLLGESKPGEGHEYPLTAEGYDEPLAHLVLPKGWAGAENPDADAFDVRSPNDVLHATVQVERSSYDQVFNAYIAEHPPTTAQRWELLGSTLPLVHADIDGCVYAVAQASFDVSVTINSCVTEGNAIDDYRPAIGQLLEGVRP